MKRFGFLFLLVIFAIIESVVPAHLSLIGALILLKFVEITTLIWWVFVASIVLDLLLGNFLGINGLILIGLILIFYLAKQFLWPNLTFEAFPRQTIAATALEVIVASRLYDFFYVLLYSGIVSLNFDLRLIPAEFIITLIFFPLIAYLSQHLAPKKQLELKF